MKKLFVLVFLCLSTSVLGSGYEVPQFYFTGGVAPIPIYTIPGYSPQTKQGLQAVPPQQHFQSYPGIQIPQANFQNFPVMPSQNPVFQCQSCSQPMTDGQYAMHPVCMLRCVEAMIQHGAHQIPVFIPQHQAHVPTNAYYTYEEVVQFLQSYGRIDLLSQFGYNIAQSLAHEAAVAATQQSNVVAAPSPDVPDLSELDEDTLQNLKYCPHCAQPAIYDGDPKTVKCVHCSQNFEWKSAKNTPNADEETSCNIL